MGIMEACLTLDIPVIGGNVSLYNETSGVSIYPTPTIGMVGVIEHLKSHTTQWFKEEGDLIALMGETEAGLGGTEYLKAVHGLERGLPPEVDFARERAVQGACLEAIKAGIISSAHDVSDGGLAVALAECCLNPKGLTGACVDIGAPGMRADEALFSESQSRIIVSLKEAGLAELEKICASRNAPLGVIGRTGGGSLRIGGWIDIPVGAIKETWSGAIERFLHSSK